MSLGRCATCYQYYRKHGADRVPRASRDGPGDGKRQCSNCGAPKTVSKGRCSACYQYFRLHKRDIDPEKARARSKRAARRPPEQPRRSCMVCGRNQVVSKGRCSSCYQHFNRHGEDRSRERTRMILARALRPLQRQCSVCGRSQVTSKGRCSSCYQYFNKHGKDRDAERARQLYERSLRPATRSCSNCGREQVTSKGRCAACYQYFRTHGRERDPAGARARRSDRREKQACVNGCSIEPRTWAERLWQKPYYGSKPIITTVIDGREEPVESGWLCATHYARWKKYPCSKRPPPPGAKNSIRVYPRGMWICKGRTLSDPGPCINVPLKLERFDSTGRLDYGKKEPDDMDTYLDGLCQDCRNAEQGVIYDKAVEIGGDPHPTPKMMKRALRVVLRELESGIAPGPKEPEAEKSADPDGADLPEEQPAEAAPEKPVDADPGGQSTNLDWGPSLEDLR